MAQLQLILLAATVSCVLAAPQYPPANVYGLPLAVKGPPSQATLQAVPAEIPVINTVYHPVSRGFARAIENRPIPVVPKRPFSNDFGSGETNSLELLPPLQHVVGTKYPPVDPGPGYRFPVSQLLNPTAPPNIH